ncbi:hypothetical protein ILUMI_25503 [Ignelater luminosus]|uniref:Acyltransferase n=1 Tax=Ignelater luminosus TaxID=2038154 RepID=A0A8K0FZZ6_IGNLU|nr:hypothetical protein ILUMI_25503 [Ignelater luminosus]
MKILGIEFAPLNIPLSRRLQTLAVGLGHAFMTTGPTLSWLLVLYVIFFTNIWFLPFAYLIWIWVFDKKIYERGGRRVECIRRCIFWKFFKEYFPINIKKDSEEVELDPKRNYLFCSFPHGLLATGVFTVFASRGGGFQKLFPKHTPHILTLKQNFSMPLFRDFLLSLGMSAASAKSINFLMSRPRGGNAALLVVGGAAESFYCKPGQYHLVLKNRKGFARLALKNGSPLVPTFSFGETDIYDQVSNPEGSLLRMFQEWVKKVTGIVPIIPLGRGYFQYSFGLVPHRKPINIIVGKPIDVERVVDPTQEQIDSLHATFVKQLTELFEKHKHKYLENPDGTTLVID